MADNNRKVIVEILHGTQQASSGHNCSCCSAAGSCGPSINMEAETEKLLKELGEEFGEQVEVKYVDVDKTGLNDFPMINRVLEMGYPYPITIIDGQPKFAGGLMIPEIKEAIREKLI